MDEELEIGRKFTVIGKKIRHAFDASFVDSGLTGTQASVLHFICIKSRTQNVYQRDIEAEFDIRRSSVTSVLHGLERNGFIRREAVWEDSRLKRLVLTDKAREITQRVHRTIGDINQTMLDDIPWEDVQHLNAMLARIIENLS